jgi:hypothetical protein
LVKRFGYFQVGQMPTGGQHNSDRSRDAGLDRAAMGVDIRDVVLADDDHGRSDQDHGRDQLWVIEGAMQ